MNDGYQTNIPIFKFAMRNELAGQPQYYPRKATTGATGWDVCAAPTKPIILRAGQYVRVPLGFKVFAPDGWWLELRPRSSTFAKKQLHCLYGVIDEDFYGECQFACQYIPDISSLASDITINSGDIIGQIIPVKRQEMQVEIINENEFKQLTSAKVSTRNSLGFGATTGK